MKCIIYARKSTESGERQVQSLDDQLRIMREVAHRTGYVVIEEIAESRSAKHPNNRPGFSRLLELIRTGKASAILVWHVNRLTRNPQEGGTLGQLLLDGEIEVIQTPERKYVSDDSPIFLALESAVAAGQSQNLSRDVTRGMESKAEKGWLPGKPPLGYRNNPWTREIEPNPESFPWVEKAWQLIVDSPLSVRDISNALDSEWPTVDKKAAEHRFRKLYALFRNPFYAGLFRFQGKLHEGKHQAVVGRAEFEFVQQKLSRCGEAVRPQRHEPLFRGLIRCGTCGGPATVTKAQKQAKDGSILQYVYYHCTGHRGCRKRVVEENVIRQALIEFAKSVSIAPAVSEFLLAQLQGIRAAHEATTIAASRRLTGSRAKLQERLHRLHSMRMDGEITTEEYMSLKASLNAQTLEVDAGIEKCQSRADAVRLKLRCVVEAGREAFRLEEHETESNLKILATRLRNSVYIRDRQVEIRMDEILQKIASFKPLISQSQSLEPRSSGTPILDWCTPLWDVLNGSFQQQLEELDEAAPPVIPNVPQGVQKAPL
ncbi:MAG: recombinase family protein [Armatimonadetes bacterium]|nr:recombinase family protein [Armatimonadota bacterium]